METTNVVRQISVLTHLTGEKLQMCLFFYWFLLLPNKTTSIIMVVRVMIVIPISEKNNMYIIDNKYSVAIISLTSFWRQTTSAYSHFLWYVLYNIYLYISRKILKFLLLFHFLNSF